jgi:hypothetical protein
VVAPFLLPLFLAGVMVILIQPLFQRFVERTHGRVRLAAGLTTGVMVMAILGPIVTATALASMQLYAFAIDFTTSTKWETLDATLGQTVLGGVREVEPVAEAPSPVNEPGPPPEIVEAEEPRDMPQQTDVEPKSTAAATDRTAAVKPSPRRSRT